MDEKISILIVDDDRRMAKTLSDIFNIKGFKAEQASSGEEALKLIQENHYDCVLSDIIMDGMNGIELFREIQKIKPETPVLLMTGYANDEIAQQGLNEGVIDIIIKPFDIKALLGFFSSLIDERAIVVIDDDPNFCKTLQDILSLRGHEVVSITEPKDIDIPDLKNFKLVFLDMVLNGQSGYDILIQIKDHYPKLPIIIVTAHRAEVGDIINASLEVGAYTCLYKPLQIDEMFNTVNQIRFEELRHNLKSNLLGGGLE